LFSPAGVPPIEPLTLCGVRTIEFVVVLENVMLGSTITGSLGIDVDPILITLNWLLLSESTYIPYDSDVELVGTVIGTVKEKLVALVDGLYAYVELTLS
jgi:hypothetical protein